MLIIEEKNLGEDASSSQGANNFEQVFYSNKERGRGCCVGQGRGCGHGSQIKVNRINNPMMHRDQKIMEEDNIEVGGFKEVMVTSQKTIQEMKALRVGIVEKQVILSIIVHQGIRVAQDNKTSMCLPPVGIQMI